MRYEDFDVLLFPAGEDVGHAPIREFKTICISERTTPNGAAIPLMTCFVPSLPANHPFQISVHSWTQTKPKLGPLPEGNGVREVWQVRVVVDGTIVSLSHLPVEAQWPQIISTPGLNDGHSPLDQAEKLRFPPFHEEITDKRLYNPADELGRIRVEMSTGHWFENYAQFRPMLDTINFSFQHAPIDVLQNAAISWPNPAIFANPVQRPSLGHGQQMFGLSGANPNMQMQVKHKRMPSLGNRPYANGNYQVQPLAVPPSPQFQPFSGNYDPNSRSTSAYSNISASAGPIMPHGYNGAYMSQYAGNAAEAARNPAPFRLPSDQLAAIISALNPGVKQDQQTHSPASMPPPPLPSHAMNPRKDSGNGHHEAQAPHAPKPQRPDVAPDTFINPVSIDRRAVSHSNFSDVSMHANCHAFPHCITEDSNGCVVHDEAAAPAAVVKGKKEGSSPTKPRDFFSTILDAAAASPSSALPRPIQPLTETTATMSPVKEVLISLTSSSPADPPGKKRTRSALKALNINGGSPEKAVDRADKPVRKASRASVSSVKSNKENVVEETDETVDLEALETHDGMVLDA